ncbi:NTP transferase domain-containing protein [Kordiimonas lacus]|uniref:Molybdenum cofactor cytidylyltransferase n=1 Tax=Kordiimonas lacus TaxID=637679 RepID=A0A1G6VKG4_9PROT|nr:molybdopterin-binding/glycosyltransferase family 2 protein [Kordiimonas lacus]SDD54021.1 molybdenum cofactor cytidylyltransferase [Kordiimonas lacus]
MEFREIDTLDAKGWSLAHSVRAGNRKLPKGLTLTPAHIEALTGAGVDQVYAFRLDSDDVGEDEAAESIARQVAGSGLRLGISTRGRCNLHTEAAGLLLAPEALNTVNRADEAIAVSTLPHLSPVAAGQLVATAKIIPYGVKKASLDKATQLKSVLTVARFQPFTAHMVVTGQALSDKAYRLTENRLAALEGAITAYEGCDHTVPALVEALQAAADRKPDLLLVLGLSAISDRRDVIPAALEAAGGSITSLGMPVDPGNLLMLGQLEGITVIGLPGCARSPALNGLDWVLERFAARLPVTRDDIADMGVGGLLKETPFRPEPRAPLHRQAQPNVQPIVLAAGRSSRSGAQNKLLSRMNGHTVVRQTLAAVSQTGFNPPILVTGHEGEAVAEALSGLNYTRAHNSAFKDGMAGSLKRGLAHLPETAEFVCVCLGDMPFVKPETIKALAEAGNRLSEFKMFIPTFNGKRGNPVLWHRDMVEALLTIEGDKGGRQMIHDHENLVCEVPVDDHGILIDLDTPEALAQFGAVPD